MASSAKHASGKARGKKGLARRGGFGVKRRLNFYSDMAAFVDAGITPHVAMERMRMVARPRRTMKWMVRLLTDVLRRMSEGDGMATALQRWVPPEEAALLSAGEKGGHLKEALYELAKLLEARRKVIGSLAASLLPALGMTIAMIGLMVFILSTVIKQAKSLVPDEMFEQLTLAPIYFHGGTLFLKVLPFLVIAALLSAFLIWWSLSRWRPGKTRRQLDAWIPPYTMFSRVQSSFFLITTSAMMEGGMPFQQAVDQIQRIAAPWTKAHLRRMLSRLSAGKAETDAMMTGMFPWDVEDRISIYKMLPDFKSIMRVTARESMDVLLIRVSRVGKTINILVMLMLATFIITTVFSIGEIALEAQSSINKIQQR